MPNSGHDAYACVQSRECQPTVVDAAARAGVRLGLAANEKITTDCAHKESALACIGRHRHELTPQPIRRPPRGMLF
jgi:hypothetical protein